ncbi:MAG: hypothetical protein TECD_00445 [Hyphomicrobiaceae bacterium hypho_1]
MNTMRELNIALTIGSLFIFFKFAGHTAVNAQNQLSDRSVQTIMDYAWVYTPDKFTPPNGKAIFIDKKKRDAMTVPLAKGREVVMSARLSAHAQICDLSEDQIKNYRSLMLRETLSRKWSPQQLVYINQLHLTTVMMLVGKLEVKEKNNGKEVIVKEGPAVMKTCTDEQRKKIKELVANYVSTGPELKKSVGTSN